MVSEVNASGTDVFHKIRVNDAVPDTITDLTLDAISNLRAALDHAAYAIASIHALSLANKAYFPISDTAAHLDSHLIGAKAPYWNTFPAEIIALLRQLQPYEGEGTEA